jgi:hypothetical protein
VETIEHLLKISEQKNGKTSGILLEKNENLSRLGIPPLAIPLFALIK